MADGNSKCYGNNDYGQATNYTGGDIKIPFTNSTGFDMNITNDDANTYASYNINNFKDGAYSYLVEIINQTGNTSKTETRTLTIDLLNPSIQFISPTDSGNISRDYVMINVSATDTTLKNITIRLYNSTRDIINYSYTTGTTLFANYTIQQGQTYYFNATAYDQTGKYNTTETRTISANAAADLECEYDPDSSSSCSNGGTRVIGMFNYSNSHAELPEQTSYNGGICCKDTSGYQLKINTTFGSAWLHLSDQTNAHAELANETHYTYNLKMGTEGGVIRCSTETDCSAYQTCVVGLSDNTNAHLSSCNSSYSTKICCNLSYTELIINLTSDPSWSLPEHNTSIYGKVILGIGENISNENISIFFNGEKMYYNETSGLLVNYTTPNTTKTDDYGRYNYTITAPLKSGVYDLKANLTHEGLYAEDIATLYVNTPPALTTIANTSWPEDTSYTSLNLSNYFTDIDGDDINWSATYTENITISIDNNTGSVTIVPDANFTGIRYVTFTAYDWLNSTPSNNVTLNVTPVNDAPKLLTAIPNQTWDEDNSILINLSNYFTDIDGDELNYSCNGTVNIKINASNLTKTVNLTPDLNWYGTNSLKCYAYDGSGLSLSSNLVILTVNAVIDCGDGEIGGSEQCDGSNLGGASCESVLGAGYTGTLSCSGSCTYITTGCSAPPTGGGAPPPLAPEFR